MWYVGTSPHAAPGKASSESVGATEETGAVHAGFPKVS